MILSTKADSKIAIVSWGQTYPKARYLRVASMKYELKTSKFFLQFNSLDFRIYRSTSKTFLVKGNALQPPPSPADHMMRDYNKSTLGEPGCAQPAAAELGNLCSSPLLHLNPYGHRIYSRYARLIKRALKCKKSWGNLWTALLWAAILNTTIYPIMFCRTFSPHMHQAISTKTYSNGVFVQMRSGSNNLPALTKLMTMPDEKNCFHTTDVSTDIKGIQHDKMAM